MALTRYLKCLTSVAAVTAFLAVATTAVARPDARTHRFAAATRVTVSFKFTKHRITGEIIRFASNRVSLARTRRGALRLQSRGRHSRRIASPGRRSRVVVTLSRASGRVRLRVGRKVVSLRGTFSAERAVAVRKHSVASFRIATSGARKPVTTVLANPAQATPAAPRFFAPNSVWSTPLADSAPLDPANAVLVSTLRTTVAQNASAGWGPWISTSETPPLYTVPANQPPVRVQLDAGSWKAGLQQTFEAVPIPSTASPGAGTDAQLTVWQPSTNRLWELFQARKEADGWHANFGGAMTNASQSQGYFDTASWPGLSQPWWGATATSLPVVGGTIMIDELKAGVIPHALAMNIPWAKPNVYSLPAQRTDGQSSDPNAIPEGARFRLDPALDIDALDLPPMTRMMAKAAQRYGMIVRDQTGHAITFFAENPADTGSDPYTTPDGFYGGPYPNAVIEAFPWDHVQLVKMDLRTAG